MSQGGHILCSPLIAPSLAATLITVICVVLTLKVTALKEASVGWIVALVLLLMALLIPTIIVWRQPQSNARLNFKVSAAPSSSASASLRIPSRGWAIAGSARACFWTVTVQESPGPRDAALQGAVPSVAVPRCSLGCGGVGSLCGQEHP